MNLFRLKNNSILYHNDTNISHQRRCHLSYEKEANTEPPQAAPALWYVTMFPKAPLNMCLSQKNRPKLSALVSNSIAQVFHAEFLLSTFNFSVSKVQLLWLHL
jgi:hypothetical protein